MRAPIKDPDIYLRKKGIKASFQRVKIFDYLQVTTSHPSVSQIFSALQDQIPSLSRATVYNTINLFVSKKLVIPVHVEGTEARYDLIEPHHAHFHCGHCGVIFDVPLNGVSFSSGLDNFLVQEAQIHFKGLCPDCKKTLQL